MSLVECPRFGPLCVVANLIPFISWDSSCHGVFSLFAEDSGISRNCVSHPYSSKVSYPLMFFGY